MIEITEKEKNLFLKRGWLSISLGLDAKKIKSYLNAIKQMRRSVLNGSFLYQRVYYDHLFDFNISAIEAPFNHKICPDEIKQMFSEIRLGDSVKFLTDWDDYYCPLARLFCMGDYKYRGMWHRDAPILNGYLNLGSSIQVGIYLERQFGFRILKKEYDLGGCSSIFLNEQDSANLQNFGVPISPPGDAFDVVGGEAGSVLFFDPQLFHQGSSSGARHDFHMRFNPLEAGQAISLARNNFQDFKVEAYLSSMANDEILQASGVPVQGRQGLSMRVFNSFGYYSGLRNLKRVLKIKDIENSKWTIDIFSNTLFQSR
jgi:hypothetical protein